MRRRRAMKLARMLVATLALVGSIGSSPVFGHSHGLTSAASHLDHGFFDHEHSPPHHDEDGDHEEGCDALQFDLSFFHLHGTWFGVSFSIPATPMPGQAKQASHVLGSDDYLIQAATVGVDRAGWDLPFGPSAHWLAPPLCAPSARPSLHISRPFDGARMPDAVLLRSVSLRC